MIFSMQSLIKRKDNPEKIAQQTFINTQCLCPPDRRVCNIQAFKHIIHIFIIPLINGGCTWKPTPLDICNILFIKCLCGFNSRSLFAFILSLDSFVSKFYGVGEPRKALTHSIHL